MYFATLRYLVGLLLAIALWPLSALAVTSHAEVLVQRVAPAQLDCWRRVEAVWTEFNGRQPGFSGQTLYYDREHAEAFSVVLWEAERARRQVPAEAIARTVRRAEQVGSACGLTPAQLNAAVRRRDLEQLPPL